MVATNAQNWLTTKVTNWKNVKKIYGTIDGGYLPEIKDIIVLSGDLTIENLDQLEELDLYNTGELDKVVIKNCRRLRKVNLLSSGVRQLEIGPGVEQLEDLNIGFEINPTYHRNVARKLAKVDLNMVLNLKELRCVGVQETELIGFENLTQLETFRGGEGVKLPTKEFKKWRENLNIITGPGGLDLLKGGLGSDKNEVDRAKLNDYKNRPTQGQLDNAKNKVKEYENGLKVDLGLNDSNLPTWRNEIAKLKSKPTGTTLSSDDRYKIDNFERLKAHAEEQKKMITKMKQILETSGDLNRELEAKIEVLGKFKI